MGTALQTKVQYVGSVEWSAVPAWAAATLYSDGALVRQLTTPAVNSERVFVCLAETGVSGGAEPTWVVTKGAKTTDNLVTWQEVTGQPGVNGDTVNSPVWTASTSTVLGEIIYDSTSGSLQIISTASGNTGLSKPTFSATAGSTVSDGSNVWTSLGLASNFGAFAAPHARILAADASAWQASTPATIYIASDHAETQASALTLAGGSGTNALPTTYASIAKTTVPPTSYTSGASVTTTGANALTANFSGDYNGITFSAATGSTGAALTLGGGVSKVNAFENCTFILGGTGSGVTNFIQFGATNIINSTFVFGATTQTIIPGNAVIVNATIAATGSVPTVLFTPANGGSGVVTLRDTDLSNITGTLFSVGSSANQVINLENCKLAPGIAIITGSFGPPQSTINIHNCDSGTKNYRFYTTNFYGVIQQETTIVDSTNPASDGTTPISWNVTTNATASFQAPLTTEYLPIVQWNNLTTGSHTATIQINSNVALTNAQIWMELEYPGSSLTPIGSVISTRAAPLSTPAAYPTSADSWGGAETNQQYMQVTFSPAMAGPIKARVYVAIPSTTIYVNPLIIVA